MIRKSITFAAGLATLAMVAPAFAQTSGAAPAREGTNASIAQIACVGTAVNARESAIDIAIAAHSQAVQAAYSARATALQQAYTGTTASQVRAAVKTAWSTFNTSMKTATKAWKSGQKNAWSQFRKVAKACKASGNISDESNEVSEVSGQ